MSIPWNTLRVCAIAWSVAVVLLAAPTAHAAFSEDETGQLTNAFNQLQAGPDTQAGNFVAGVLTSGSHGADDWQAFFRSYFATASYTASISSGWQYILGQLNGTPQRDTAEYVSALSAAEAVAAALPRMRPPGESATYGSLTAGVWWLSTIREKLDPQERTALLDVLRKDNANTPAAVSQFVGGGAQSDAAWAQAAIQLCLALADYADPRSATGRTKLLDLVELPDTCRRFWEKFGILVFDGGLFTSQHVASLDSLFAAVPMDLHHIVAVFAEGGVPIDRQQPNLMTDGQLIFLAATDMSEMTDRGDFPKSYRTPPAPVFTATAGQTVMRAIQTVQFAERPSLRVRRDGILVRAGHSYERYLRQKSIPMEAYFQDPDLLLPADGYLYFTNSPSTFRLAKDLFNVAQKEAMDAFLLMTDLMSGGGTTTYLFQTDEEGIVSRFTAPIGRTQLSGAAVNDALGYRLSNVPDTLDYVTSITLGGIHYAFELNAWGGVSVLVL